MESLLLVKTIKDNLLNCILELKTPNLNLKYVKKMRLLTSQSRILHPMCEKNYKTIIQNSDKVIILFRENYLEQKESWLMSINTKKWGGEYFFHNCMIVVNLGRPRPCVTVGLSLLKKVYAPLCDSFFIQSHLTAALPTTPLKAA